MPTKPLTYDDITRRTVVGPDGSFRPSRDEEAASLAGPRGTTPEEQVLHGRVMAALAGMSLGGQDLSRITVEVDRECASLRGDVSDPMTITKIERRVREVPGIADVKNELIVRAA